MTQPAMLYSPQNWLPGDAILALAQPLGQIHLPPVQTSATLLTVSTVYLWLTYMMQRSILARAVMKRQGQ